MDSCWQQFLRKISFTFGGTSAFHHMQKPECGGFPARRLKTVLAEIGRLDCIAVQFIREFPMLRHHPIRWLWREQGPLLVLMLVICLFHVPQMFFENEAFMRFEVVPAEDRVVMERAAFRRFPIRAAGGVRHLVDLCVPAWRHGSFVRKPVVPVDLRGAGLRVDRLSLDARRVRHHRDLRRDLPCRAQSR
jgi:hypothetical protein